MSVFNCVDENLSEVVFYSKTGTSGSERSDGQAASFDSGLHDVKQ